jgi:hypothetical protein
MKTSVLFVFVTFPCVLTAVPKKAGKDPKINYSVLQFSTRVLVKFEKKQIMIFDVPK